MNRKIKIAFVTYLLDIGGLETLILELCRNLDAKKYLPVVYTFQKNGRLQNEFENAGIPIIIIKKKYGTDWTLPIKLAKIFKESKIGIVHTHNESPWLYAGIAAKITNLPLVHTDHTFTDYHEKRWVRIYKILSMLTSQITTVSKGVADILVHQIGIPAHKVKIIYNGVDLTKYTKSIDVKAEKKNLSITERDVVVGNVSRLVPIKDHMTLIYAFRQVVQRVPYAKLLIVGDGPLKNKLLELRDKLGLEDSIKFLGFQRNIPDLLKVFDIFAFSSIPSIKEGLSISVLEAMASGLPVVSTGINGTAEAVIDGQTGIIVPPGEPQVMSEAICRLLFNSAEAKCMGEKGRERVKQHFSFEKMIGEYESIYDSIVNL